MLEKEIQGTGLGMAITKSIVDSMRGTIAVYSTMGKGSRFEVVLPFELDEAAARQRLQNTGQNEMEVGTGAENSIEKPEGSILKGMHFLCAEDNDLNAEILKSMLDLKGAFCVICSNGKQVVEAFEKSREICLRKRDPGIYGGSFQ